MSKEAMRQALEALEYYELPDEPNTASGAANALREALAQPAERQGEAVHQWGKQKTCEWRDGFPDHEDGGGPYKTRTLYTHPAPAQQPSGMN